MNTRFFFFVLFPPLVAPAAVLTQVPMQGGMVMPMIAYDAGVGRLTVAMPPETPQLTPLLVSHPGDRFDPASPWYSDLDPAAGGLSFSRRYGFVMDMDTDPLPVNTAIWIRKTSGPEDLNFHRYATTPTPGVWTGIFGTDGSAAELMWNGMMFHPAVSAPPGTNRYEAVFEAYLVNTQTMQEVADSGTGPMVFRFTSIPDGRPALTLGPDFMVAWDASATNYLLEQSTTVMPANWTVVTNLPEEVEGSLTVLMEPGEAAGQYFRLRMP